MFLQMNLAIFPCLLPPDFKHPEDWSCSFISLSLLNNVDTQEIHNKQLLNGVVWNMFIQPTKIY